jgi:peptide/nickel transport system substrate-binding protein
MSKKDFCKSLFLVFLFFILISLPSEARPEIKPDYGDSIVVGSIGDARTLIPIIASDSASAEICSLVFNGLVKYDKDINLVPDLAESWQILDNGLTILFKLKKNVRWHDGVKFSAKDVEFTFKKLIDPNTKTPYSGDFEKVKNLEVIDDYTLKVSYIEPFAPGLASWGMPIMPEHLLKNEDFNKTQFSRKPVGTGPYKFKLWNTQEKIILEANDDYFEGRPYIDRYIYRVIPDQATLFLEIQVEGVDFTGLSPFQDQYQTNTKFFKKSFNKYRIPSFGFTYLGFNLKNPFFIDSRVRKALDYAIDKQEIIRGVLLGLGKECTGPFIPDSWAYNPKVLPHSYNPGKARELLKESGWQDTNNDGWLDKDSKIFEFTIITNQGNDERKTAAEIIQKRLKEIGIRVKIKVIEWSAFISEFIDKRRFDACLLGWSLSRDPDNFDIWHSSKTREGEFNFISYKNPVVDALLETARKTFNQEERAKDYKKIHELIYEDCPYVFLYVPDSLPIINKRFLGIKPAPLGLTYDFIKWWVPREMQKYNRIRLQK